MQQSSLQFLKKNMTIKGRNKWTATSQTVEVKLIIIGLLVVSITVDRLSLRHMLGAFDSTMDEEPALLASMSEGLYGGKMFDIQSDLKETERQRHTLRLSPNNKLTDCFGCLESSAREGPGMRESATYRTFLLESFTTKHENLIWILQYRFLLIKQYTRIKKTVFQVNNGSAGGAGDSTYELGQ